VNRVVDVAHPEGGSILLEVDALADGPDVRGRVARRRCLRSSSHLRGSARRGARRSQSRGLADAPYEITIEGPAQLGADAAVIIARAGAEADAPTALRWLREPPPLPAPRCPRTADTGMMRRGVGWRGCPGVE
jgi:hypothetical protein